MARLPDFNQEPPRLRPILEVVSLHICRPYNFKGHKTVLQCQRANSILTLIVKHLLRMESNHQLVSVNPHHSRTRTVFRITSLHQDFQHSVFRTTGLTISISIERFQFTVTYNLLLILGCRVKQNLHNIPRFPRGRRMLSIQP